MRRFDSRVDDAIAEKAASLIRFNRLGRNFKPAFDHALPGPILRQTAQVAARIGNRRAVGADRDVAKIVQQSGAPGGRTLRCGTAEFNIPLACNPPEHLMRSDTLSCNFSEYAWVLRANTEQTWFQSRL